jgi:hypothetical protein
MNCYENRSRRSPIVAYESDEQSIAVKFFDGSVYRYTYETAGNANVEQMKCPRLSVVACMVISAGFSKWNRGQDFTGLN